MTELGEILHDVRANHNSLVSQLQTELGKSDDKIRAWQDRARQEEKKRIHAEKAAEKALMELGQVRATLELFTQEHNHEIKKMFETIRELQMKVEEVDRTRNAAEEKQKVAERMLVTFQSRHLKYPIPQHTLIPDGRCSTVSDHDVDYSSASTKFMSPRKNLQFESMRGSITSSLGSPTRGSSSSINGSTSTSDYATDNPAALARNRIRGSNDGRVVANEIERIRAEQQAAQDRIRMLEYQAQEHDQARRTLEYTQKESETMCHRRRAELAAMQLRAEQEASQLQRLKLEMSSGSGAATSTTSTSTSNNHGIAMSSSFNLPPTSSTRTFAEHRSTMSAPSLMASLNGLSPRRSPVRSTSGDYRRM